MISYVVADIRRRFWAFVSGEYRNLTNSCYFCTKCGSVKTMRRQPTMGNTEFDTYDPKIIYTPDSIDPDLGDTQDMPAEQVEASSNPSKRQRGRSNAKKKTEKQAKSSELLSKKVVEWFNNGSFRLVLGIGFVCFGAYLLLSFISFLSNCIADQSAITNVAVGNAAGVENSGGEGGARLTNFLVDGTFGLASIVLVFWLFAMSLKLLVRRPRFKTVNFTIKCFVALIALSLILGLITIGVDTDVNWGGAHGRMVNESILHFVGWTGAAALALFVSALFVIICLRDIVKWILKIKRKQDAILQARREEKERKDERKKIVEEMRRREEAAMNGDHSSNASVVGDQQEQEPSDVTFGEEDSSSETLSSPIVPESHADIDDNDETGYYEVIDDADSDGKPESDVEEEVQPTDSMVVNVVQTRETTSKQMPTFAGAEGMAPYEFPPFDLLRDGDGIISVDQEEQQANKELITNTLANFDIAIDSIEATVGPTVSLYEIIPEKTVRIQRIRALADDIALRLAATGVRIIAPIPGKGTIGIEVANKVKKTVWMRSAIKSEKFQQSKAELPIVLGSTISSGVYVCDLASMPHLIVAGATGQGKSVGLNAIIASLLYRKTPDELKFVLVDPKMVEFSIYEKIEKHYLAAIPGSKESIITDMNQVVATLNSLCIEMEDRYKLLRSAQVRKITEYNQKFLAKNLRPDEGHRFMPYIVLVIDEFADLILTQGKVVETPVARLAAKARAVGIHVILATQTPRVNVITGTIKGNFPARIAFKTASGIDSKTILDSTGAEKLIGKGDMLISHNSSITRVQCAFIDTPDVVALCDNISRKPFGIGVYQLPEPQMDSDGEMMNEDYAGSERDSLFEEAARYVVMGGMASVSGLQRRYAIGYNRAGKIMDQLEKAGIVGPNQGGKPRSVLMDPAALELLLNQ